MTSSLYEIDGFPKAPDGWAWELREVHSLRTAVLCMFVPNQGELSGKKYSQNVCNTYHLTADKLITTANQILSNYESYQLFLKYKGVTIG